MITDKKKFFNPQRLISGTFMQLDHWDDAEGVRFQAQLRSLTPDHWRQMLNDMVSIGIDTLVFQQCFDGRHGEMRTYYKSKKWKSPDFMRPKPNLYTEIVDEADKLGIKIYHSMYGMNCPNPSTQTLEAIQLAKIATEELAELYSNRPSFAGWYWTWEYPPTAPAGRDSLQRIIPAIREVYDAPIMIAPNADRNMCATVLQDIDVDIIAYQDTVGLGVVGDIFHRFSRADRYRSLARLPFLYEELRYAHNGWATGGWNSYSRPRGRTALWNDLEIWEFNRNKELIPAELSRIVAQLDLTAPYVDKQIIYQYPGLMNNPDHPIPVGGERAMTLYADYAEYRKNFINEK